jgi:hypothetical protein
MPELQPDVRGTSGWPPMRNLHSGGPEPHAAKDGFPRNQMRVAVTLKTKPILLIDFLEKLRSRHPAYKLARFF